jgi:MFS family permease
MIWRLILISSLPLILVGFDVGLVSAAIRGMRLELELTELQESVAASATYIVGAIGGLYCGHLADRYGRRNTVLIAVSLVVVGTFVAASSPGPICVVLGRSILGVGCGLLQAVTPILLAEIAPADKRGFSVACAEVMITGGNVLGAFVGFIFCESKGGWRSMFLMNSLAGVTLLAFFYLQLPESPRWIAARGKTTEALALLIQWHVSNGTPSKQAEEEARKALNMQSERKSGTESAGQRDAWREVLCTPDPAVRRMMAAGLGVAFFSQACGSDLAIVYSSEILSPERSNRAHLVRAAARAAHSEDHGRMFGGLAHHVSSLVAKFQSTRTPLHSVVSFAAEMSEFRITMLYSIILAGVQFPVLLGASLFFDKIGRKPFLLFGSLGLAAAHTVVLCGELGSNEVLIGVGLLCIILAANASYAGVTAVICSEIFPMHVRAKGMALCFCVQQLVMGLIMLMYLPVDDMLPATGPWPILIAISLIATLFVWFCVPETKGKTLEEIEDMFRAQADAAGERSRVRRDAKSGPSYGTIKPTS